MPEFAVTDVTYCEENERLYVVTGYCDGDFVLTASQGADGKWAWGPTAWGGKGDGAAQFQTAHGIFAHGGHIFVANREAHQVLEFTPEGALVRMLGDVPVGARICNVARAASHASRTAKRAARADGWAEIDPRASAAARAAACATGWLPMAAATSAAVEAAVETAPGMMCCAKAGAKAAPMTAPSANSGHKRRRRLGAGRFTPNGRDITGRAARAARPGA